MTGYSFSNGVKPVRDVPNKYDVVMGDAGFDLGINHSEDKKSQSEIEKDQERYSSQNNDASQSMIVDDDDIDILGMPYSRNNPYYKKEDSPAKEITYGTSQVAQMLGVTAQTIRNYVRDYNEYLGVSIIQTATTERAQFTQENVDALRELIRTKDENNFTTKRMQEYMADPSNLGYVPESKKYDKTVELLIQTVKGMLEEEKTTYLAAIKQKDEAHDAAIDELNSAIKSQNEQIGELTDLVKEQQKSIIDMQKASQEASDLKIAEIERANEQKISKINETSAKEIKELNDKIIEKELEISNLQQLTDKKDEYSSSLESELENGKKAINELTAEKARLIREIEELKALQSKKKKFLGIFG